MTRRTALVSAAAVALVLAPTAAMAYDAPGFSSTVSDPAPAAGQSIVITVDGDSNTANQDITLTVESNPTSIPNDAIEIAGTKSFSKPADDGGLAVFNVTLNEVGTYSAVATTVDGTPVSTFSLKVGAAAAAPVSTGATGATGAAARTSTSTSSWSSLAATGFDGAGLATGAGALVLAGAGAVMVAKRRQSAQIGA